MTYSALRMKQRDDRVRLVRALRSVCGVSLTITLAVAGCAPKTGFAGFLGDYSQLKRDAFLDNSLAYTNPAKDLKQYKKFILDPVVVHFAPDAEGTAIDPADVSCGKPPAGATDAWPISSLGSLYRS
jgi:hypothetical protein